MGRRRRTDLRTLARRRGSRARTAKYSPAFLQWATSRKHRNPETDNLVEFVSLPPREQKLIYRAWSRRRDPAEEARGGPRGVVPVDRNRAREKAGDVADLIAKLDLDPDRPLGEQEGWPRDAGTVRVTDVRGRTHEIPVELRAAEAPPGAWRARRRYVPGATLRSTHETERGEGTPARLIVRLDGQRTPAEMRDDKDRVENELYGVLIHELTHAADVLRRRDPAQEGGGGAAYHNRPSEVRAFKQQIADEIQRGLYFAYRDEEDPEWIGADADSVMELLSASVTWDRIKDDLTPANRRSVLKTVADVVRRFKRERGGRTASARWVGRAWLRRAVSQPRVDEVLRKVKDRDLPFGDLFGDARRIFIDAPEVGSKFAHEKEVREILERLGMGDAEVDFESGKVRVTQQTRHGPKVREQRLGRLLQRGVRKARQHLAEMVQEETGKSEKEVREILETHERAQALRRRTYKEGGRVGSQMHAQIEERYPVLFGAISPPRWQEMYGYGSGTYGRWRQDRDLEKRLRALMDPDVWTRLGEQAVKKRGEAAEKMARTEGAKEEHAEIDASVEGVPQVHQLMMKATAGIGPALEKVLGGLSEDERDAVVREHLEHLEKTGQMRGRNRDTMERVWGQLLDPEERRRRPQSHNWGELLGNGLLEDRPATAKLFEQVVRAVAEKASRPQHRKDAKKLLSRGEGVEGVLEAAKEAHEKHDEARRRRKEIPAKWEIAAAHVGFVEQLLDSRSPQDWEGAMEIVLERARETEDGEEFIHEYRHENDGDEPDDADLEEWMREEAPDLFSRLLTEVTGITTERAMTRVPELRGNAELLAEEVSQWREDAEGISEEQVAKWREKLEGQLESLKELNEEHKETEKRRDKMLGSEHVGLKYKFRAEADAERVRKAYDRFQARPPTRVILSRDPIDVLRMSDHPDGRARIQSCHSEGGQYFHCAIDEAQTGGAVAYLVTEEDAEDLDLDADEIFEDKVRGVEGVKPFARVRLHRFTTPDGREVAVPAASVYGLAAPGLATALLRWSREQQRDLFDDEDFDPEKLKLSGGAYLDMKAPKMIERLFARPPAAPKEEKEPEKEEPRAPEQRARPERREPTQMELPLGQPDPSAAQAGAFWEWMGNTFREVPNPNPEGRQRRISPSTLKEYSEGGEHRQRAQQLVRQYVQQFQQQQQQQQRVARRWLKMAISQAELDRVLDGVHPGHLPFENIFGGKKRLVIDAADIRPDFQEKNRLRFLVEQGGLEEGTYDMDVDGGTAKVKMPDGRTRQQRLPKLVSRGIAAMRRDWVRDAKKVGLKEKEATEVLAAEARDTKRRRRIDKLVHAVGDPFISHMRANLPELTRTTYVPDAEQMKWGQQSKWFWERLLDPDTWNQAAEKEIGKRKEAQDEIQKAWDEEHWHLKQKVKMGDVNVAGSRFWRGDGPLKKHVESLDDDARGRLVDQLAEGSGMERDEVEKALRGREPTSPLARMFHRLGDPDDIPKEAGDALRAVYGEVREGLSDWQRSQAGGFYEDETPSAPDLVRKIKSLDARAKKIEQESEDRGTPAGKAPIKVAVHKERMRREGRDDDWEDWWTDVVDEIREDDGLESAEEVTGDPFYLGIASKKMLERLEEEGVIPEDAETDELWENLQRGDRQLKNEHRKFQHNMKNLPEGTLERWREKLNEQLDELEGLKDAKMKHFRERSERRNQHPELIDKMDRINKAERSKIEYDKYLARPPMKIVISRSPVDLLRMSDHPNAHAAIESCHSYGKDYYSCAVDEAQEGGAIAYLVSGDDADKIDLEADEIFEDRERNLPGVKPYGRVRLHRVVGPHGDEIALPADTPYGVEVRSFPDKVLDWARRAQPGAFDLSQDPEDYEIEGGTHLDTDKDVLLKRFFAERPEEVEDDEDEAGADEGDFWRWMERSFRQVPNPNPEGRERQIAPSTLRDYAEQGGEHQQRAQQLVRQYMQQFQQAQQQQRVTASWLLRVAKYSEEFLKAVSGRRFRNPETGNDVQFVSLPDKEQKRIHDQWRARGRAPAQALEPHLREGRYDHVKFDMRSKGEKARRIHRLVGSNGDEKELRRRVLDLAGMGTMGALIESVDVHAADKSSGGTEIWVMGRGRHGIHFHRNLNYDEDGFPSHVHNEAFSVKPEAPEGIATRMLMAQVPAARDAGFGEITTWAIGEGPKRMEELRDVPEADIDEDEPMQGYYVWPRLGFDAEIYKVMPDLHERMPEEVRERMNSLADDDNMEARFRHLMMFPEGRDWWREWGDSADLSFPLDDTDPDYDPVPWQVLSRYAAEKARLAGQAPEEWLHRVAFSEADDEILDRVWDWIRENRKTMKTNTTATRVASMWIRRMILAKYSPEFYRSVFRKKFHHPETGNMVMFHSLPDEEQKKIHDQWAARQQLPQARIRRKDFERAREESRMRERGEDPHEEQAAAKADRKEMAQAIKALKDKGVPGRIVDKERRRLIQEMESRRLRRKREREQKLVQQLQPS